MSQPVPPPSGNPYAQGTPGTPGNPFAPAPPPAPVRNNIGLGLIVAVVTALVTAGAYGALAGAIEAEVGYAAVAVGFLIGFAAAKTGGPNPVLPIVSAVLAVGAVYLGQLVGMAVIVADELGGSFTDVFFDQFSLLTEAWSEVADGMSYLFLAIGAITAFGGAKKANG
ncbi:hypothetical protein [Streptomyces zhihengii]|uniref:Integral membrane protein n=1 Tax=Streptomyces zhihengii TaxID=1818004 RepID=A0ABS2UQN1_9ACTN|nr:hypothetical protein [Streptomyces zhihengii]MBM9619866.1 hypothetical protein [Streptomyces zhihengii]